MGRIGEHIAPGRAETPRRGFDEVSRSVGARTVWDVEIYGDRVKVARSREGEGTCLAATDSAIQPTVDIDVRCHSRRKACNRN